MLGIIRSRRLSIDRHLLAGLGAEPNNSGATTAALDFERMSWAHGFGYGPTQQHTAISAAATSQSSRWRGAR
jgi:hypothetical protein